MRFYSTLHCELFVFDKDIETQVASKVHLDTSIKTLDACTSQDWQRIRTLQGGLQVLYLKYRYGSRNTYILCGYADGGDLAHIEWIVPAYKIRHRYPFIEDNCYAVISCLTSSKYRGMNIYPSQLQKVAQSEIPAERYFIWAESDNVASIKGIQKAGARKVADIVQHKYCFGLFSKVEMP